MVGVGRLIGYALVLQSVIHGVSAAEEAIAGRIPNNTQAAIAKRHTLKELRDQNVVKQQLDYSCGAAALATLISNYFGEETAEREILDLLNIRLKELTDEEISRKKRVGFSLLDLKYVAHQKGYQAAGFKLTLEQLRQLKAPVIVFVRPFGYHHFAVLRGIAGNRVFLADPSRGNLRMSIARFSDEYGGIIFVLGKAGEEKITNYPLALSLPDDALQLNRRRSVDRVNDFSTYTINLAVRAQPR